MVVEFPLVGIPGAPIVGYLVPEPARRQHSAWRGRKVEVLEDLLDDRGGRDGKILKHFEKL
jgi:hypothetical protein